MSRRVTAELGCTDVCVPVLGIATFTRGVVDEPTYRDGTFRASSGEWILSIEVYQQIRDLWGPGLGEQLLTSVVPVETEGQLPVFVVGGAFRWATDLEIPLQMEVSYPSFVVRRGCGDLSLACSGSESVQMIPSEEVVLPAPAWDRSWRVSIIDGG